MERRTLQLVFYRQSGQWICHSVEMNIEGRGETQGDSIREFATVAAAQLDGQHLAASVVELLAPAGRNTVLQ